MTAHPRHAGAARPDRTVGRSLPRLLAATGLLAATTCLSATGPLPRPDLTPDDLARVQAVTRPATSFDSTEPFESMPAGAATTSKIVNADIFSHPSTNLDFEGRQRFFVGNGLFRKDWVSAPSSTQASDGLGPLFNARSCQACHVKDGRGAVPAGFPGMPHDEPVALLLRLAIPAQTEEERQALASHRISIVPDPVYGGQLQNFAVPGMPAEGSFRIHWEESTVELAGGETATLRKPVIQLRDLAFGPLHDDVMLSLRLAPPMIGLGLLEAIHDDDILANADRPNDPDGVVGRPNRVWDVQAGRVVLGRFGWKAGQPSVEQQGAEAFSQDMGLSTPVFPDHAGGCTRSQAPCRDLPHGAQPRLGEHEVPAELFTFVDDYARNLAVPRRRNADEQRVLAGKRLFYESRCVACHVPKYVTRRDALRPEHSFQLIWPYTDLLLHDMGEGLADHRPEGVAGGRDWRTSPLWGIGHTATVNPDATYLHDGRARTLLEAILWHGGEAQAARDRVVGMSPEDRADLIRFLESL
jgi:CxxC motif-containing protein (DUF1111 family)